MARHSCQRYASDIDRVLPNYGAEYKIAVLELRSAALNAMAHLQHECCKTSKASNLSGIFLPFKERRDGIPFRQMATSQYISSICDHKNSHYR